MKYKYTIHGKEDTLEGNKLRSEASDYKIDWLETGKIDTDYLTISKVPDMLRLVGNEEFKNLQKGDTIEVTRTTTEVLILEKE